MAMPYESASWIKASRAERPVDVSSNPTAYVRLPDALSVYAEASDMPIAARRV